MPSKAGDKHLDIACFQRLEIIGDKKGQKTLRRRLAATTRSDRQLRNPRLFRSPNRAEKGFWTTFSLRGQAGYRDDVDAVRSAIGRLLAREHHKERGSSLFGIVNTRGELQQVGRALFNLLLAELHLDGPQRPSSKTTTASASRPVLSR